VDVDGINDDNDDDSRDAQQQRNETSKTGAVVMRNASNKIQSRSGTNGYM
jgi:hypothetical protein